MRKWRLFAIVIASSSCGTGGLLDLIKKERAGLADQTSRFDQVELEEVAMTWPEAKRRMLKEELSLKKSRSRIHEIKRQRKQQWREWLPRPSLYLSLQSELRELSDLNRDDISASLYAPLAIPNPLAVRTRAYEYALQELQAVDSLEARRRQLVIQLYGVYKDWQALDEKSNERLNAESLSATSQIQNAFRDIENANLIDEKRRMIQVKLSRLLNMPGRRIVPLVKKMPDIDYQEKLGDLKPGKNYGQLAIRMSSYQIVSAVLRSKGIRVSQWQVPGVSVGVPAIYDINREDSKLLDSSEQISLFSSWSRSFDMTGRVAASIESAEEYVGFVRQSLLIRMDADQREWDRLKQRYKLLIQKRDFLRARMATVLANQRGDAEADLLTIRKILNELRNIEDVKMSLDSEIWRWDDNAWK